MPEGHAAAIAGGGSGPPFLLPFCKVPEDRIRVAPSRNDQYGAGLGVRDVREAEEHRAEEELRVEDIANTFARVPGLLEAMTTPGGSGCWKR